MKLKAAHCIYLCIMSVSASAVSLLCTESFSLLSYSVLRFTRLSK